MKSLLPSHGLCYIAKANTSYSTYMHPDPWVMFSILKKTYPVVLENRYRKTNSTNYRYYDDAYKHEQLTDLVCETLWI
jgi:hypothetical protein